MIFEFLFPILGWLILFGGLYFIYNAFFYNGPKNTEMNMIEGQSLFTMVSAFFWIVVYMCLSSIWSISYTLIDLKFPDIISAPNDYGNSGLGSLSGAVYDAMAFPLATLVVCAVTSVILAFWIIAKQKANPNLRPDKLYQFIRFISFLGGAILAFSGFVYVVYAWLYGSLPVAVFLKGIVAFVIVGAVALYFYLVADKKRNPKESLIGRAFAIFLFIAMLITLFVSFKVVGTPKEARMYRLDALKLQDLQSIKYSIDAQDQSSDKKIVSLSDIKDDYVKNTIKRNEKVGNKFTLTSEDKNYKLCADFVYNMPTYINQGNNNDETWNYNKGNTCFSFEHKENMNVSQKAIPYYDGKPSFEVAPF